MSEIYKTSNKKLRKAMFHVFGGKCFYSGRQLSENGFEIDHIVPLSKGGKNSVFNYVLVDKEINCKKSNLQNTETIDKILYIVSTAYAPKVLKIMEEKPVKEIDSVTQYFTDKGFSEKDAYEIKTEYIDKGYALDEAWLWFEYGCLLSEVSAAIETMGDGGRLQYLKKVLSNMVSENLDKE